MADNDVFINGDSSDFIDAGNSSFKNTSSFATDSDSSDLNRRISALELEKSKLEKENDESAAKVSELKNELAILRREKETESERADSETRAAEAIAKRASELEGEVFRLQHDLITSLNTGEDQSRQISDLQAKISEMETKAGEQDNAIEALKIEKKLTQDSMTQLEAVLGVSNTKVKETGEKTEELVKKLGESDKIISGLMEKRDREASADNGVKSNCSVKGLETLKTQLPLIGAVSAGALVVATTAVFYTRYNRN